ncbi:MAG: MFS transporter [Clostridiales bacterium]|nr:MFS transporter [Clostridiales bacterium]MBQ3321707.1 MFS transporter [Bacillota bacterium]
MGKILNSGYGAIFGTYWVIYAVVSSFASVFMLAKGYTNSQIGVTLAAANVLAVIMQPLIADFVDRSKRLDVIGTTEIMTVCMMVFTIGMFTFKGGSLGLCVVFVLLIAFHTVLQPLFNSLAFRLEEAGVSINFGIARSVGSLAYSIFVAVFGTIVEHFGINVMPIASEISCLLLIASLAFTGYYFNKGKKQAPQRNIEQETAEEIAEAEVKAEEEEEINLIQFIKRNKMFFIMNLGVLGIFFSNAVLNNYMAQICDGVGGTTEDMGRILGVMAFLEIPTMVFFKQLRRRFSCQFLLKIAAIGFTVKIAICWLANSVVMLYIGQLFQPVSFALFLPGMVYFSDEMMSRGEAVKGQALFTTMITITTIFATLLGGMILDASGSKMLTFVSTLLTAAGALVIILAIDRVKSNK